MYVYVCVLVTTVLVLSSAVGDVVCHLSSCRDSPVPRLYAHTHAHTHRLFLCILYTVSTPPCDKDGIRVAPLQVATALHRQTHSPFSGSNFTVRRRRQRQILTDALSFQLIFVKSQRRHLKPSTHTSLSPLSYFLNSATLKVLHTTAILCSNYY